MTDIATDPRLRAIGNALHAHRTAHGLSVRQMGRDLHLSGATISRIENAVGATDTTVLLRVLDYLGLTGTFLGPALGPVAAYNRGWDDCARATRAALLSATARPAPAAADGQTSDH